MRSAGSLICKGLVCIYENKREGTQACEHMAVSINSGTPKWMVIMEHPIKMDDLGYHYFWKHPYLFVCKEMHA